MAHRASSEKRADSLELLLDTICNTFGGILFISLLVVILVNMTSKEASETLPEKTTQAELIRLQRELESAQRDLEVLKIAVAQQSDIQSSFVTEASQRMANEIRRTTVVVADIVQDNNKEIDDVTNSQKEVNQISKTLSERKRSLKQTKEELSQVSPKLEREFKKRSRSAQLPRVREWTGQGIAPFFLKEGALCYLRDSKQARRRNENGKTILEPVVAAGLRIDAAHPNQNALDTKFQEFSPKRHLIRIWLSPDSHQEWASVRDSLVRLGFRYQLDLIPPDEYIVLTDKATVPTRAQ
jgi:hypothetical protein